MNQDISVTQVLTVNGTANIIICDGAKLNCQRGISVVDGNSLNIYSQQGDKGVLKASRSEVFNATIGGENGTKRDAGNIAIYGGDIFVEESYYGAGIGGGNSGSGGNITIFGGSVTTNNSRFGAGIGGGLNGNAGNITIYDGEITTKGEGTGIGGGTDGIGGNITINGGVINASSTTQHGIGSNECDITLSWIDPQRTMSVTADSYDGNVMLNKEFKDKDGNIYIKGKVDNVATLAGKVLTPKAYYIIWKDGDNKVLKTDYLEKGVNPVYHGETPTKKETDKYKYTFSGWNPKLTPVTTDIEYKATFKATEKNIKANIPIIVKTIKKTIKKSAIKKKTRKIKAIRVRNAQGAVVYKVTKVPKKLKKKIKINSKGIIIFKKWKKVKKGTYKIKVRITAAGNTYYKPKTINKTIKIKVVGK